MNPQPLYYPPLAVPGWLLLFIFIVYIVGMYGVVRGILRARKHL